jgi:hypothetical protein
VSKNEETKEGRARKKSRRKALLQLTTQLSWLTILPLFSLYMCFLLTCVLS